MTVSYKESHERMIRLNRSAGNYVEIRVGDQFCFQGEKQICLHNAWNEYKIFLFSFLQLANKGTESVI